MIRGKILKISAKNHWKSIVYIIVFLIFFLMLIPFGAHNYNHITTAVLVALLIFLFWASPAIFVHIDYYQRNKNTEYEILPDKMLVRKRLREATYMKSDIKEIHVYISNDGRISATDYNFVRIDMKNDESIYLTSLLYPRKAEDIVKKYFTGVPYYIIRRSLCTTLYKSWREKEVENEKSFTDPYGLFKDDDREYNSITEFKSTRNTEIKI